MLATKKQSTARTVDAEPTLLEGLNGPTICDMYAQHSTQGNMTEHSTQHSAYLPGHMNKGGRM